MGRRGGWSYQPAATKAKKRTKRSGGFRSLNPRNWSAKRFEEEFPGIFENDDKKDISPSDADELSKLLASGPEELCDTIVPASSITKNNNIPSPASTVATTASKTPSPPAAKVIVQKAQAPKPRSTPPRPSNLPDFQEEHLGDFERQMREKYGRR